MPSRSDVTRASAKSLENRTGVAKRELASGERFLKRLQEKSKRNAAAMRRLNPLMNKTFKIRKSLRSKKIDTNKILEDLFELTEIHGENITALAKRMQVQEERIVQVLNELAELKTGVFEQLKRFVLESEKKKLFENINKVRFPGDEGIGGLSLEDSPIFSGI